MIFENPTPIKLKRKYLDHKINGGGKKPPGANAIPRLKGGAHYLYKQWCQTKTGKELHMAMVKTERAKPPKVKVVK